MTGSEEGDGGARRVMEDGVRRAMEDGARRSFERGGQFWHWTFTLKDADGNTLAEIERDWRGFGFEMFTDAGQYAIRFGSSDPNCKTGAAEAIQDLEVSRALTLTERAVTLALAVSLDSHFFSRHGGWGFPIYSCWGIIGFPVAADLRTNVALKSESTPAQMKNYQVLFLSSRNSASHDVNGSRALLLHSTFMYVQTIKAHNLFGNQHLRTSVERTEHRGNVLGYRLPNARNDECKNLKK